MTITEEIQQQLEAGFSAEEIMANLRNEGYAYDEINQHLKAIKKAPSSTKSPSANPSVFSIIISLIAAVSLGLSLTKRGYPAIGIALILIALIFFITSLLLRFAKK